MIDQLMERQLIENCFKNQSIVQIIFSSKNIELIVTVLCKDILLLNRPKKFIGVGIDEENYSIMKIIS